MDNKDLKYPTSEDDITNDIDAYLKLLEYGQKFRFKDLWYDRHKQLSYRTNEDSFVDFCRDTMKDEGLIRVVEKREFERDDILTLTTKGLKIKNKGWTKYSKSWRRNWDNTADKVYKVSAIIGVAVSVILMGKELYNTKQDRVLNRRLLENSKQDSIQSLRTDRIIQILHQIETDSTTTDSK